MLLDAGVEWEHYMPAKPASGEANVPYHNYKAAPGHQGAMNVAPNSVKLI